ncbi:hypothetical protein [Sciscionella marina]|uniref:hypothetical protein n=1 Tax=Sciscionella marina TaxID=508770 RepID=UPI000367966F|nr:hypothetical protein [Sciscionella marina]
MAAHEQKPDNEAAAAREAATEEPKTTVAKPVGKSAGQRALELRAPIINLVAGLVRWVGVIFAVVLVVHIILVIGEANPNNGITGFVHSFADTVAIGFKDLFTPDDAKLAVLVNYGIAAIFWLIVSALVARILKRFA